jgi:hypothetical protein
MTHEQLDHFRALRVRSMRIAVSLSDLDRSSALEVVTTVAELLKYIHAAPGQNAPLVVDMLDALPARRPS